MGEKHELNRDEQREEVVRWLGERVSSTSEDIELLYSATTSGWHRIVHHRVFVLLFELAALEFDDDNEWVREGLNTLWILDGLTWKDSRVVGRSPRGPNKKWIHTDAMLYENSSSAAEAIQRCAIQGTTLEVALVRGLDALSSSTFVMLLMRKIDGVFLDTQTREQAW